MSGLDDVASRAKRVGGRIASALHKPLVAGFEGAKNALGEMGGRMKGLLATAAELGGVFGAGAAIKGAVDLQSLYGQIAFQIDAATGAMTGFQDIHAAVGRAAKETGRTHAELGAAMKVMLDRGADPAFALQSMSSVGHLMNATGQDAERVGRVLAGMSKMYGISGGDAAKMLDGVASAAAKGGVSMEEFFEDFTEFGSIAQGAGMRGKEGLSMMLGLIARVGPQLNGTTSEISSGMDILFERLRDVGVIEKVLKSAGVQGGAKGFASLRGATEQIDYLMSKGPDAMAAFKEGFTGREEKVAFDAMLGPYFETLNTELKAGKTKTEAHASAMSAVKVHVKDLSKPIADLGKVAGASATEQQTAAGKLREVQNVLMEAMASPDTLAALNSLAKDLPKVAQGMAKLVAFVTGNPLLAGGGFVAGRMALGAAGGGAPSLAVSGVKAAGSRMAAAFAADVASHGKWGAIGKNVGAAAGIAIAAYVAYELGKKAIDKYMGEDIKVEGDLLSTRQKAASVARTGTREEKAQVLAQLRAQIAAAKKEGPGALTTVMGGLAHAATGGGVKTAGERHADMVARAEGEARDLEASLSKGGSKVEQSLVRGARALEQAADKLDGKTKPGGHGLPAPPGSKPGHE